MVVSIGGVDKPVMNGDAERMLKARPVSRVVHVTELEQVAACNRRHEIGRWQLHCANHIGLRVGHIQGAAIEREA